MTSGTSENYPTNEFLTSKKELIEAFSLAPVRLLKDLQVDWSNGKINPESPFASILERYGFLTAGKATLNRSGVLFLSRILIDFGKQLPTGRILNDRYEVGSKIRIGKNSAIYFARHQSLDMPVVLKLIRPGAADNLQASLKLLASLGAQANIVRPIDLFKSQTDDVFGQSITVDCVVYPVVTGISLKSFLAQKSYHLNSHVALSFIKQIGGALHELEKLNAYHGDLHDENIFVEQNDEGVLRFSLIDISFGSMGSLTIEDCKNRDMIQFRQHIWRILSLQKSYLPKMSLRKFLGTRQYLTVNKILSGQPQSFAQVIGYLDSDSEFFRYQEEKTEFVANSFNQPKTFRLQRYEEIIDPSVAARLFVPFPELMERVSGFSNAFVSGNRGSGKSTYLASLAYFASNSEPIVNISELFGIYFPCRQGEFKSIYGHAEWTRVQAQERTTALIIVKIIRRTLEELAEGVARNQITEPSDLDELRTFLNGIVPAPGIVSVQEDLLPQIKNFASSMVRIEMELLSSFRTIESKPTVEIQVKDLITFFTVIRNLFAELSATRFHILFDDAGTPNLTQDVQRVLCDLILTSNPLFCIKFSAEKFTFSFESSFGKVPENGHDYFEHDISHMLFIGSHSARLASDELERYFKKIVEQRLAHFRYSSTNILDYLGDNRGIAEQIIGLLAAGRKDAKYAGWTAVWHIADRTPRNLLELVSEIFAYADIRPDTAPKSASIAMQDRAIRAISEKRLASLSQIAGSIVVSGKKVSLGRRLFEITVSIGSTFRSYLRQDVGKPRKRQHLAIERNDLADLSVEATDLLLKLISFGVLDDSKYEYSRDDVVKKPIYVLNRIYCPAFAISYRRDDHLRLSRAKFELLLLNPEAFIRNGTKRLTAIATEGEMSEGLFGFSIYE